MVAVPPVKTACRSVAIWGSCATRDAFAVESRANELSERLQSVYYAARTSWISQASPPWQGEALDLSQVVNAFGQRAVQTDLDKTAIDRIIENHPDLVVFDLLSERLPVARFGRTWVTVSQYLEQTDLGPRVAAEADALHEATSSERPGLFAAAARRIARRLIRDLPESTFVLHEAPFTDRVADGTVLSEPEGQDTPSLTLAQKPLVDTLVQEFGPRLVRAKPPRHLWVADPNHRWGRANTHYVQDYYHWVIDTLLAVPDRSASAIGMVGAGKT
jgi:hypothetical protein